MGIEKLAAEDIVRKAGMSARPGFYSGRGALIDDLNYRLLTKINTTIKENYGENASKSFVQMVADIPTLSATDFLLALYRLEGNDWTWSEKLLGNEKGRYFDNHDEAFGTVAAGLVGELGADATQSIRNQFLRENGIRPKRSEWTSKYGY